MRINKKTSIGLIILLASILLFVFLRKEIFSMFTVDEIHSFVSSYGIISPIIYILILVLAIIVSNIPNIPITVASGTIFGPCLGGIYSLIGGTLGAIASFFIARSLGRPVIKRFLGKTIYFCDRCNEEYIGLVIFISRLLPFFSFDIISYGAGFTNIRFRTFLIATFFGMIPMTFLFSYLGGFILINKTLTAILSIILIVAFFGVPLLIHRYNLFGMKDRIVFR